MYTKPMDDPWVEYCILPSEGSTADPWVNHGPPICDPWAMTDTSATYGTALQDPCETYL